MRPYMVRTLFSAVFWLSAHQASARDIDACPSMPALRKEDEGLALSINAGLLNRLVANFEVSGEYKRSIDDIFGASGGVERAKYVYLATQCVLIMRSYSEPARQREEFRREWEMMFGTRVHGNVAPAPLPRNNPPSGRVQEPSTSANTAGGRSRLEWERRYFSESRPGREWSVVVASPQGEDNGWRYLESFKSKYPDIQFRLRMPYNSQNPHWAIIVGDGLERGEALNLVERVKAAGVARDAYIRKPDGF